MSRSLYKNALYKTLLNIFNLIIPVIIGPYIMRVLSTEQIGNLNYAQSIFGYFFIFGTFGIYQYGIREISRVRKDKRKLENIFSSLFIISIFTNIIAGIIYMFVVKIKVQDNDLAMVCNIFTIYFFSNIFMIEWVNEALENFKFITIKTIIIKSIYVLLIFIFVRSSKNYVNYILLIVLSSAINNIVSYIYIKRKLKFRLREIRIINHIIPMFMLVILSNANVLYTQLDRLMIGNILGATILSFYAIAQGVMGILNSLMKSIIQVSIPKLNLYVENEEKEIYMNLIIYISKIYFMLIFPLFIGMTFLSEEIIVLYGGNQYVGGGIALSCFSIYMITLAFDNIIGNQIMYIHRKEESQVKILLLGGILNLIFNIILVIMGEFRIELIILSTSLANIFVIYLQKIYVKKNLDIDYKIIDINYFKYLIISLIFIPIIYLIKLIFYSNFLRIFISAIICPIIYSFILIIIKDGIFMGFVDKVKNKLFK